MKLTLLHQTTPKKAIKTIENELNKLMKMEFPGLTVIDPKKEWDDNIMRFSFGVQKMFFTLEFSGNVIVTDQEVILESNLPRMLTTFVSEEKIKEVIREKFNQVFNIK